MNFAKSIKIAFSFFLRIDRISVERYNTEANTWTRISDMIARRSGAGVGVLENVLYAVGGHDGPLVRKSCEKYNSDTDTWAAIAGDYLILQLHLNDFNFLNIYTFIQDMTFRRRNAGVIAHNGFLYVVGGDDGSTNLSNVEVIASIHTFLLKNSINSIPLLFERFIAQKLIHGEYYLHQ